MTSSAAEESNALLDACQDSLRAEARLFGARVRALVRALVRLDALAGASRTRRFLELEVAGALSVGQLTADRRPLAAAGWRRPSGSTGRCRSPCRCSRPAICWSGRHWRYCTPPGTARRSSLRRSRSRFCPLGRSCARPICAGW